MLIQLVSCVGAAVLELTNSSSPATIILAGCEITALPNGLLRSSCMTEHEADLSRQQADLSRRLSLLEAKFTPPSAPPPSAPPPPESPPPSPPPPPPPSIPSAPSYQWKAHSKTNGNPWSLTNSVEAKMGSNDRYAVLYTDITMTKGLHYIEIMIDSGVSTHSTAGIVNANFNGLDSFICDETSADCFAYRWVSRLEVRACTIVSLRA